MFQNHIWESTATIYMPSLYKGVTLSGDSPIPIEPSTGNANYSLALNKAGRYFLFFTTISTPSFYDLSVSSTKIDIFAADYVTPVIEVTKNVKIVFSVNYNTVIGGNSDYFLAAVYNQLAPVYTNVTISNMTASSGEMFPFLFINF